MTHPTSAQPTRSPGRLEGVAVESSVGEPELADLVSATVRAVPGVVDLHPGMFGEVATYLPGRRVTGIQVREHESHVHVVLDFAADIPHTADAIREAVEPIVGTPVHVTIQDLAESDLTGTEAGRDDPS